MKGILEFNLPEEQDKFETACQAPSMSLVIWELDRWLRDQLKYHEHDKAYELALADCKNKLLDLCEERKVTV